MNIPSLFISDQDGRARTRADAPNTIPEDGAVIFELRPPLMELKGLDEQNMLNVCDAFFNPATKQNELNGASPPAPWRGFIGLDKQKSGLIGIMTQSLPGLDSGQRQLMSTELVTQMALMCYELKELAKKQGLVPKGRDIHGELIRFDVQVRDIQVGQFKDSLISPTHGLHRDNMMAMPRNFTPDLSRYIEENFYKGQNRTTKGIAALIYLRAEPNWSGTELCMLDTLVFKPTTGDVVIINELTPHGVCNAHNLSGATKPGEARILLRLTMPYDE